MPRGQRKGAEGKGTRNGTARVQTAHPIAHPLAYFWYLNRTFLQIYFLCNQGVAEIGLVRDQEVEGSNPSAPTKFSNNSNKINICQSAERRFFRVFGSISDLDLLVSDQGAGRGLSNLPYKLASRSPGWQRPCLFLALFAHRPMPATSDVTGLGAGLERPEHPGNLAWLVNLLVRLTGFPLKQAKLAGFSLYARIGIQWVVKNCSTY